VHSAWVQQHRSELVRVQEILICEQRQVLHQRVAKLIAARVECRSNPQRDLLRRRRNRQSEKHNSNRQPMESHFAVAEVFLIFAFAGAGAGSGVVAAATGAAAAAGAGAVSNTDEMTCGPLSCVDPPPLAVRIESTFFVDTTSAGGRYQLVSPCSVR